MYRTISSPRSLKSGDGINDQRAPRQISSQSQRHGPGAGLLDALHESRRCQAMREIDNYRHLLDEAKADEIRGAIEELTREGPLVQSFWPLNYWLRKDQSDRGGRDGRKGMPNMSTKLPFHRAPLQSGGKPHLIDRGRMSVWMTVVIITSLGALAILHVIGGTLIMRASDRPLVEPAHMYLAD